MSRIHRQALEMGNLGRCQNESRSALGEEFRNHVRSHEGGQSCSRHPSQEAISKRRLVMDEPAAVEVACDDLDEMFKLLSEADVVEGPPGLKKLVEELWPELVHKVKPPRSEMH
jgi:hypothetical protein